MEYKRVVSSSADIGDYAIFMWNAAGALTLAVRPSYLRFFTNVPTDTRYRALPDSIAVQRIKFLAPLLETGL